MTNEDVEVCRSEDFPVVVQVVDKPERIETFLLKLCTLEAGDTADTTLIYVRYYFTIILLLVDLGVQGQ